MTFLIDLEVDIFAAEEELIEAVLAEGEEELDAPSDHESDEVPKSTRPGPRDPVFEQKFVNSFWDDFKDTYDPPKWVLFSRPTLELRPH